MTEQKTAKAEKKSTPPEEEIRYEGLIPNLDLIITTRSGRPIAQLKVTPLHDAEPTEWNISVDATVARMATMDRDQLNNMAACLRVLSERATEFLSRTPETTNGNGHADAHKPAPPTPIEDKPIPINPPTPVPSLIPATPPAPAKPAKPGRRTTGHRTSRTAPAAAQPEKPTTLPPTPAPTPQPATPPAPTAPATTDEPPALELQILAYLNGPTPMTYGELQIKTGERGPAVFTAIKSLLAKNLINKGQDNLYRRNDRTY